MFEGARREIEYAYDNVAFFRAHMEVRGLTPGDIRAPGDMALIPPTRKADYRRNYPAGVLARGYTLNDPKVLRFQSSGNSGERLNSAILLYDLARRQATSLAVNRRFDTLWRPGARPRACRYAPPNCSDVECATGLSSMADRVLADGTLVLPVAHDLLATPPYLVQQALDEIAAHDPEMLVVDPTHLAFLIRRARETGRSIRSSRKLHVICGYTLLTQVARRQIAAFLGTDVPIADMLGMSELGYLGFECHEGNRHINNQDFYVEFLTPVGPAAPGSVGELVVTTIGDALLPRIRYATGDLYRLVGTSCSCGSDLPVVRMEGRASQVMHGLDGSMLTPLAVDEIVGEAPFIDVYRFEQDEAGKCVFRYIPGGAADRQSKQLLKQNLADALGGAAIELAETRYIPADRSGKFLSCISTLSSGGYH
ncbi:phenylacetate--CoA ligase family protein [Bradyrhizobium sp. CB1015]|uniref:phenylacetate--CoA ligase family protein n=1 Tax=Bradyrhizobium sp. CB1015 TaxID=2976822 RepID=UPI0021AAE6C7|nr:hypothetical protein [Bradyrhizobium sp. CB1015]UWU92930.1 hypothetical protein N2604_02930 [Bradyrhizobium sp. CB1015]